MANILGKIGLNHKQDEKVILIEFNLDELYDLQARYSNDDFSKDIQQGIEIIEKTEENESQEMGLQIVVEL